MSKLALVLLLGTVGFGLVSLHLVRELRAERTHSSALQTELDSLKGVSAAFKNDQASKAAPDAVIPAPSAPPGERAPTSKAGPGMSVSGVQVPMVAFSGPGSSPEEQMKQIREMHERQRALLQDPAYREAMISQQMDGMRMFQRGLGRELGLSDEQYERLLALQAEQQIRSSELLDPFARSDGANDDGAWQEQAQKLQELQQRNEKELKALLGEQKYRAYQEYQQSAGARAEVTQLNMMLAEAGMPMREDQVKPLIRAIHESQMSSQEFVAGSLNAVAASTPADFQQRQLDIMREQNKRLRNAAARVLSDEQVQLLTQQQEDRLRMHENQLRMVQAQADAIARGELPAAEAGQLGIAVAEGYFVPAQ